MRPSLFRLVTVSETVKTAADSESLTERRMSRPAIGRCADMAATVLPPRNGSCAIAPGAKIELVPEQIERQDRCANCHSAAARSDSRRGKAVAAPCPIGLARSKDRRMVVKKD